MRRSMRPALPKTVTNAFLAIEDRRFRSHWGSRPARYRARDAWHNMTSKRARPGRQHDHAATREERLPRFGPHRRAQDPRSDDRLLAGGVAEQGSDPVALPLERLFRRQRLWPARRRAALFRGEAGKPVDRARRRCWQGWSRRRRSLRPPATCKGARDRAKLVVAAMVEAASSARTRPRASARHGSRATGPRSCRTAPISPIGCCRRARPAIPGEIAAETTVTTTLDRRLQRAAERAVARAGLHKAQVAIVAMRPDGRVVAMVGGKSYADSPFNRATQAQRQPGSAFKLMVYLAALRSGMTPDSMIDDSPVTIGQLEPEATATAALRGPDHACAAPSPNRATSPPPG